MIGVFDSGFGGLTILKELLRTLPQYQYIYLGDNARAPYGNKSEAVIYQYTRQAVDFLFKQGCYLVVIACNTASSEALRRLQQEYLPANYPRRRILGVIIPAAEAVAGLCRRQEILEPRIGLLATAATVKAGAYEREIKKLIPRARVFPQACPLLVDLVEENWLRFPETKMILKRYLRPLEKKRLDYLLLGCTHYPFLLAEIKALAGRKIKVINPPPIVAFKAKDYLARHPEIEKRLKRKKRVVYYTTDESAKFFGFCRTRLRFKNPKVNRLKLSG